MILGRPVYDESVPKSRLYGRYLTHVWVWIETLSLTIRDSMCGFRLYPLDARVRADRQRANCRRAWTSTSRFSCGCTGARAAFRSIPTRVTYASDGVSHFDVLWDNVRISRSHTRLVFGHAVASADAARAQSDATPLAIASDASRRRTGAR